MPLTDIALLGPRVKIERAKKHVIDLEAEIRAYGARHPCIPLKQVEPQTGDTVFRVQINEAVPVQFAAYIGDAIHNTRTALDLLACALVESNGQQPSRQTYFPISADKGTFEADGLRKIKGASPRIIRLIRHLKPYKGGNDALWQLHQLDIMDKHKLIVPVGASHIGVQIRSQIHIPWEDNKLHVFPPLNLNTPVIYPLADGAELFRITKGSEDHFHENVGFTFDVAFGDSQILNGESVAPTLRQFIDFTERLINILAKYA